MNISPLLLTLFASATIAGTVDPCKLDDATSVQKCFTEELARKDKDLNSAYQRVIKELSPAMKDDPTDYTEVKRLLVVGQRAWITFRDNDCNALGARRTCAAPVRVADGGSATATLRGGFGQIGRASCRERVCLAV